jgi:hypothetical protein
MIAEKAADMIREDRRAGTGLQTAKTIQGRTRT